MGVSKVWRQPGACLLVLGALCGTASAAGTAAAPAASAPRAPARLEDYFPVSYTHLTLPTKRIV